MRWFEIHQWKPADDAQLRSLVSSGLTQREIARQLKKSLGSVSGRIYRLKLQQTPEAIARKKLRGRALPRTQIQIAA